MNADGNGKDPIPAIFRSATGELIVEWPATPGNPRVIFSPFVNDGRILWERIEAAEAEVARLRAHMARALRELQLADPIGPVGSGPRALSDLAAVERIGREVAAGEPEPFPEPR